MKKSDSVISKIKNEYFREDVKNLGCIYLLIFPNFKCYIGQSWYVGNRFSSYKTLDLSVKKQIKLWNALNKYDPKNVIYKIIDICNTQEQMDDMEIKYIKLFDSQINGYNISEGGVGGKCSEETKKKISIGKIGNKNPMFGKKLSKRHRKKLHNAWRGEHHTKETKKIIGDKQLGNKNHMWGKKLSNSHKKALLKGSIAYHKNNKKIYKKHEKQIIRDRQNQFLRNKKWEWLYIIQSPEGKIFYIKNLQHFCNSFDYFLDLRSVVNGWRRHSKGWIANKVPLTKQNKHLAHDKNIFIN